MNNLAKILIQEHFEFKERVPMIKKVGEIHKIQNNVSTTLRNYEFLMEKREIIDFAVIPAGGTEYEIYVKYPIKEQS